MRGIDSGTAPLLCGEGSRMDKRGGENQQGNGEFPGWRKRMEDHPTNPAAGCLLRPWRFPRPSFPTPSIYHSAEDALLGNVLLGPPGPLASGLLSPQPAWCAGKSASTQTQQESFVRFLWSSLFPARPISATSASSFS